MMPDQTSDNEHEKKRRKVRKGTHSCWECRRRKTRCQYASPDDSVCIGCTARGSDCRSQELIDDDRPPPPEGKLAQRLGKLEEMMEKLVDKIMPDDGRKSSAAADDSPCPCSGGCNTCSGSKDGSRGGGGATCSSTVGRELRGQVDVLETSTVSNTPVATLLGIQDALSTSTSPYAPTPGSDGTGGSAGPESKYRRIRHGLYPLFPSQEDAKAIVQASPGAHFVAGLFHCQRDVDEGRAEPPSSIAVIPPVSSHPAVIARRLLQLSICMMQLPSAFHLHHELQLADSLPKTIAMIDALVSHAVTSDDELVGFAEGLECLILLGFHQANSGNLRKAWMSFRRALNLAQLMGLDRGNTRALRYCDPASDPMKRWSAEAMWYRINSSDRYLSLLLGLSVGTQDNGFAADEFSKRDTMIEKLQKQHAVISARVIGRNQSSSAEAYAVTQVIDCDLDAAAKSMGRAWWEQPLLDLGLDPERMAERLVHIVAQVHHYTLLILLHLPYMLRDPAENRYDYSKVTCMRASRDTLKRFVVYRQMYSSPSSCRHVDYASLIAAMTLLLGYLGPRPPAQLQDSFDRQRREDRALAEKFKECMELVSSLNSDRLSREAAGVIQQLLPIIDLVAPKPAAASLDPQQYLHLSIPYLGKVNIRAGAAARGVQMTPASSTSNPSTPAAPLPSAAGQSFLATPPAATVLGAWPTDARNAAAWQDAGSTTTMAGQDSCFQDAPFTFSAADFGGSFMRLEPNDPALSDLAMPDLTAESDDWAFQGVDTTYWSLLNSGMSSGI